MSRDRKRKLPGADARPLDAAEAAAWDQARAQIDRMALQTASGELTAESFEFPKLNLKRVVNAIHVPADGGDLAGDLEKILRRVPDGWGRWIECDRGWYPLIVDLDRRLAAMDFGYELYQVKEKYGTLCYYCESKTASPEDFQAEIRRAENLSSEICEQCGKPGVLMQRRGWLKTLCVVCGNTIGYGPKM